MSDINQYQAPQSQVDAGAAQQFGEVKVFSITGRIGRVRYIAYNFGISFLIYVVGAILLGIAAAIMMPAAGEGGMFVIMPLMAIMYIAIIVYQFTVTIRRCRDFNVSGWLSLLILVPFVNLIFILVLMIVPGTQGENNYGPPPPPNSTGVVVAALIIPVSIILMGILAAIAIPAYQGYIERAQELQQQQQLEQQR